MVPRIVKTSPTWSVIGTKWSKQIPTKSVSRNCRKRFGNCLYSFWESWEPVFILKQQNVYQKTKQIVDSGLHTFILDFIDNIFYNKTNNDYGDIIISFLEILFLFSKRGRIKKYFSLDNLEKLRKYLDYYNDNNDIFSIEICNIIENILNNIKNNVNNYLTEEESSELPKIKFKITNDDDICPICHNEFIEDEEIVLLKCNHKYHNDCIREWSHHLATCPLCTKEIEI